MQAELGFITYLIIIIVYKGQANLVEWWVIKFEVLSCFSESFLRYFLDIWVSKLNDKAHGIISFSMYS